jgi:hypothetical protein
MRISCDLLFQRLELGLIRAELDSHFDFSSGGFMADDATKVTRVNIEERVGGKSASSRLFCNSTYYWQIAG